MGSEKQKSFTLYYMDLRARGEPIRWLLCANGIEFKDIRIDLKQWSSQKSSFEWGKVPVLDNGEVRLHQTTTICRYIAEVSGTIPRQAMEAAKLQEVVEAIHDITEYFGICFFARLRQQKDRLAEYSASIRTRSKEVTSIIEQLITEEGWIRSDKMTYADVFVASYCDLFENYVPHFFDECPRLLSLVNRVRMLPAIERHLELRKDWNQFEHPRGLLTNDESSSTTI